MGGVNYELHNSCSVFPRLRCHRPKWLDTVVPKKLKMIKYEHRTKEVQLRTEFIICQLYFFLFPFS